MSQGTKRKRAKLTRRAWHGVPISEARVRAWVEELSKDPRITSSLTGDTILLPTWEAGQLVDVYEATIRAVWEPKR